MNRLKVLLPVAVVLLGVAVVAVMVATRPEVQARPPEVPVPRVDVRAVEPGPVTLEVRTHGTVTPRTESALVPEVAGRVEWVSPALVSGGFFDEGEPLLRIDPSDYESGRDAARAALVRAESERARAERELARQQRLAEREVASAARLDEAQTAARVARAAELEARAALQRAEQDLARTELRAPFRGRVRSEQVDVGQFVSRGQTLAVLYAVDHAEVRLPLADDELAFVDVPLRRPAAADGAGAAPSADAPGERAEGVAFEGPPVELRAEFAGAVHTWQGRVVRTEGEIDPRSHMVHVVARVEDPYGRAAGEDGPPLAVGLFVEARIRGHHLERAVVLPREALRGEDRVWVVDGEGRLRIRPVEVLRRGEDAVVLTGGLEAGERVVISALGAVVDGMRVRPRPAEVAGGAAGPEGAAPPEAEAGAAPAEPGA